MICLQDPDAIVEDVAPDNDLPEAAEKACAAFADVFKYGPRIELDHHLVYHARESCHHCGSFPTIWQP